VDICIGLVGDHGKEGSRLARYELLAEGRAICEVSDVLVAEKWK
jgi:hypothetical protein